MSVNLDRHFGSLNLANMIINGNFSGFELVFYTDVPSIIGTDALNESHFSYQTKGMRFLIQEWLEKTRVVLYQDSEPLAEVEYNNDNPILEILLRKLCNPPKETPFPELDVTGH